MATRYPDLQRPGTSKRRLRGRAGRIEGKPGKWSPGAKEGSDGRRREGPTLQIPLRVKSEETRELTTELGRVEIIGDLDKNLFSVAFRENGRGQYQKWGQWKGTKGSRGTGPAAGHQKLRTLSGWPVGQQGPICPPQWLGRTRSTNSNVAALFLAWTSSLRLRGAPNALLAFLAPRPPEQE